MTAATAEKIGMTFEDFQAMTAQQIPTGSVGQPDDIAASVAFFARDDGWS